MAGRDRRCWPECQTRYRQEDRGRDRSNGRWPAPLESRRRVVNGLTFVRFSSLDPLFDNRLQKGRAGRGILAPKVTCRWWWPVATLEETGSARPRWPRDSRRDAGATGPGRQLLNARMI